MYSFRLDILAASNYVSRIGNIRRAIAVEQRRLFCYVYVYANAIYNASSSDAIVWNLTTGAHFPASLQASVNYDPSAPSELMACLLQRCCYAAGVCLDCPVSDVSGDRKRRAPNFRAIGKLLCVEINVHQSKYTVFEQCWRNSFQTSAL